MTTTALPVVGIVRAARRRADCSQREFARRAGVARSTVGRIEAGSLAPSLATLGRLLAVAGVVLVAVDADGRRVQPMLDRDDLRDGAGRRYPSHLDTILDPRNGAWWAEKYGMALPPETYYRDRRRRDAQRRRSVWEVRVQRCRGVPPPPDLRPWLRMRASDPVPGGPTAPHRGIDDTVNLDALFSPPGAPGVFPVGVLPSRTTPVRVTRRAGTARWWLHGRALPWERAPWRVGPEPGLRPCDAPG